MMRVKVFIRWLMLGENMFLELAYIKPDIFQTSKNKKGQLKL